MLLSLITVEAPLVSTQKSLFNPQLKGAFYVIIIKIHTNHLLSDTKESHPIPLLYSNEHILFLVKAFTFFQILTLDIWKVKLHFYYCIPFSDSFIVLYSTFILLYSTKIHIHFWQLNLLQIIGV
ncbi:MAG: hypothetical protein K0S01_2935 [Herbinix sp.]|jgi:hypothetical protein|nr:hypothetical protein [Herbinix sp.]